MHMTLFLHSYLILIVQGLCFVNSQVFSIYLESQIESRQTYKCLNVNMDSENE